MWITKIQPRAQRGMEMGIALATVLLDLNARKPVDYAVRKIELQ